MALLGKSPKIDVGRFSSAVIATKLTQHLENPGLFCDAPDESPNNTASTVLVVMLIPLRCQKVERRSLRRSTRLQRGRTSNSETSSGSRGIGELERFFSGNNVEEFPRPNIRMVDSFKFGRVFLAGG